MSAILFKSGNVPRVWKQGLEQLSPGGFVLWGSKMLLAGEDMNLILLCLFQGIGSQYFDN